MRTADFPLGSQVDLALLQALEGFKPNGMHGHLIRMIGTSILGWALNGLMALGYQSEHDQKAFVFGRLVVSSSDCVDRASQRAW